MKVNQKNKQHFIWILQIIPYFFHCIFNLRETKRRWKINFSTESENKMITALNRLIESNIT